MGSDVFVEGKQCSICKEVKSLDEFRINNNGRYKYHHSYCRICDNKKRSQHQKNNRSYYDVRQKEWRDNHKERIKEINCKANIKRHVVARQDALEAISGENIEDVKCIKCGFSDIRAIQIDHIEGGGGKHFRKCNNSVLYYQMMLVHPEKYQLLCANCNWIKRYENNERCSKYGQD